MLKHRVIPILLYDGSFCVVTEQFNRPARRIGPINQYVNNLANRDIDELVLLDIYNKPPDFKKIKSFTEKLFCPVAYGGGINSLDDIKRLIQDCGVDKIVIKTQFAMINSAANKFGSQAIIYAMDTKYSRPLDRYLIDRLPTRIVARTWANLIQNEGAGEIMLTDINMQGKMKGYNIELLKEIDQGLSVPLIINGGCGNPDHMVEAIKAGADAMAAGTMFCLRGTTPQDCARALRSAGLPSRVSNTG